ncbi:MAG: hypothetical protein ACRD16_10730 [Thermoanaerobaculia bacterium]
MMKIISARVHGVLDYAVVGLFLIAPKGFHLSGVPSTMAYVLAAVHLGLTLLTKFPGGLLKLVPLSIHGGIEFIVSLGLMASPWILSFSADSNAQLFYISTGALVFIVWLFTDYKSVPQLKSA